MNHQCCSIKKGKKTGCMPNGKCCGGKNCGLRHKKTETFQEKSFSIFELRKQI